jgi:uncharacterized phage protein gp47/JayE
MPLFADSKKEIFSDVFGDLTSNTNITKTSAGSKARSFIEAVTDKIGDVWSGFDLNMAHAFIDGAEGKYLDYFGDMFGLSRLGESSASTSARDQIIKFYRSDSTGEIPIPQGTIISTATAGGGTTYVTTEYTTLLNGFGAIYVGARSTQSGSAGNLSRNSLVHHNVAIPEAVVSILEVTNDADILTGRGIESDANFRFRLSKQVLGAETGNSTAIRLACLSVPGVADIVFMPFFRGVGTFDVLIKSISPSVSQNLINDVRQALFFVAAQGVSYSIRGPKETGVSMTISVILKEGINSSGQTNLINNIQTVMFDYIDNLDIGEELIINEIVQRVMAVDDNIKTIGSAGKPIDEILLWKKESRLSVIKTSKTLFSPGGSPSDYAPAEDEKLLIELIQVTGNPITVKIV